MTRPHMIPDAPASALATMAADRRLLAGYDDYLAAQRVVDQLSDAGFPVEHVAIVGSDLRMEEVVTGRMTNARAALLGTGRGAIIGAVVGLFLGLFTTTTATFIALVLWAALWGAVLGAVYGFLGHAFMRGQRDFASRSAIVAGRYDVLVTAAHLEHARSLLIGERRPDDTAPEAEPQSGTRSGAEETDAGPDDTAGGTGTVPPPRAGSQTDAPASRRTP